MIPGGGAGAGGRLSCPIVCVGGAGGREQQQGLWSVLYRSERCAPGSRALPLLPLPLRLRMEDEPLRCRLVVPTPQVSNFTACSSPAIGLCYCAAVSGGVKYMFCKM